MSDYLLRPEARPIAWDRLTSSQRAGFTRVVDLLRAAVDQLPPQWDMDRFAQSVRRSRLALDFRRSNQVVMISGKRGTGKTSVFLSLRWYLSSASRNDKTWSLLPEKVRSSIAEIKDRLVWLETLDLEPLPHRSSLFSAIIARIEEAVREEHGDWPTCDSWTGERQTALDHAIWEFERLANDVAFAWEDVTEPAFPSHLEPESYARDARRAELARLSLRSRLDDVLTGFAHSVKWQDDVKNPLFILTIDDFDLNPRRCLELLRLLRGIGNSRLFPIILGDLDVARLVLDLKMQGELVVVHKGERFPPEQLQSLARTAKGLATEAVRKLLPPDQRVVLRPLTIDETMKFIPAHIEGAKPDDPESAETMRKLIELLSSPAWSNGSSEEQSALSVALGELFSLAPAGSGWPDSSSHYSGLHALSGTVREITDRWIAIRQLLPDGSGAPIAVPEPGQTLKSRVIELFWRELFATLRSEERLPDAWLRELKQDDLESLKRFPPFPLDVSVATTPLKRQFIAYPPIDVEVRSCDWLVVETSAPEEPTRQPQRNGADQKPEIEERSRNGLILVHDLIEKLGYEVERIAIVPSLTAAGLVRIEWSLLADSLSARWVAPGFKAFFDLERFGAWWNRYAARLCGPTAEFEYARLIPLATAWLLAGFASAARDAKCWEQLKGLLGNLGSATTESKSLEAIKFLMKCLNEHIGRSAGDVSGRDAVQAWAIDAAIFLAPEYGVPSKVAETLVADDHLASVWGRHDREIRTRRSAIHRGQPSDLTTLLLNPRAFEAQCKTQLDQAVHIVRRSEQFESLRSLKTPQGKSTEIKLAGLRVALDRLRKSYDNRGTAQGKNSFKKHCETTAELLQRAVDGLNRLEAPGREQTLFRDPEVSETLQLLSDISTFVKLLEVSYQLQLDLTKHPINRFSGGILCPDTKQPGLAG